MKKIIIALILILLVGCQSETENKAVKNDNSILYVGGERVVEGEGSYDIGDLSSSQFLYDIGGQYYWRIPLTSVYSADENHIVKSAVELVSLDGAFLTNTDYKEQPKVDGVYIVGDGTDNGNMFYVFIPASDEHGTSGKIIINTVIINIKDGATKDPLSKDDVDVVNELYFSWKKVTPVSE